MSESNRRHFARKNTDVAIQVLIVPAYPKGRENNCDSIAAKMVNRSADGVCFQTDRALEPGANVVIKMDGTEDRPHSKDAYYMHDGRIIWCKKVDDDAPCFAMGVKILRKAVQADILISRFTSSTAVCHRE
jgi:hypothetical protein